jgi:hypothetical protein
MIKLYNKELVYEVVQNYLYEILRNNKFNVFKTDIIDNSDDLYIVLGGEFLIDFPKNYIAVNLIPTSHLTIVSKVEAYWIDKNYLDFLKGSKLILDFSNENIRVWNDFYKYSQTSLVNIEYKSCLLLNNSKIQYDISMDTKIYLFNHKRGKKFFDLYEKKYNNLNIVNTNNYVNLIETLKRDNAIFIYIYEYEQSIPNIFLVNLLRYNNIPCLLEKSRDNLINKQSLELGCYLENYIILTKKFGTSLTKLINYYSKNIEKPIRKENNILDDKLVNILSKYNECCIKNKNKIQLYDRKAISPVESEILVDGGISLKLGILEEEDFPSVSICTPTADRRHLFSIALYNFLNINYPKNKLEWVILDDGKESIEDIVPRDKRIKYHYNKTKKHVSDKRNKLVELSSNDIIVFMDDDDFYTPENIIARVKSLIKYKDDGIECVGCSELVIYDIINDSCAITSNGDCYLCESTMAFYRKFWLERPFKANEKTGEFRHFMEYRQHKIMSIPFQFVSIAITHNKNTTNGVRSIKNKKDNNDKDKIKEIFGEEFNHLLKSLRKFI